MAVSGLNRDKIAGKKKPSTEYPRVAVSGLNRDFSSTEYPMVTVSGLNRDKIARKVARSVAGKYKPLHWPRIAPSLAAHARPSRVPEAFCHGMM